MPTTHKPKTKQINVGKNEICSKVMIDPISEKPCNVFAQFIPREEVDEGG